MSPTPGRSSVSYHSEVTGSRVEGGAGKDKTQDRNEFGDGNVPCALVVFAGANRPADGDEACNEVRWASEDPTIAHQYV